MLQFKSRSDLNQLSPDDPAYSLVDELIQRLIVDYEAEGYQYDPSADGFIVLVQEDTERAIDEIWDEQTFLVDLFWEGFTMMSGFIIGVYLANNQWGLTAIFPNESWLDGEMRELIERDLDDDCGNQGTLYEDLNQGEST